MDKREELIRDWHKKDDPRLYDMDDANRSYVTFILNKIKGEERFGFIKQKNSTQKQ